MAAKDVEALLLELWSSRHDAAKMEAVCDALIAVAPTDLGKVEMYLPQFAHVIIALPEEVPTVAPIERFVLSVCQLSIHIVTRAQHTRTGRGPRAASASPVAQRPDIVRARRPEECVCAVCCA